MRVFMVHADPEPNSFSGAMTYAATAALAVTAMTSSCRP